VLPERLDHLASSTPIARTDPDRKRARGEVAPDPKQRQSDERTEDSHPKEHLPSTLLACFDGITPLSWIAPGSLDATCASYQRQTLRLACMQNTVLSGPALVAILAKIMMSQTAVGW
jgi:hypothetical protein